MANHKQAVKRNRQRDKRRLQNRRVLGSMRTAIRRARRAVDQSSSDAQALVHTAVSRVDRAVSKGALHRKTGSRLISRLSQRGA